MVFGKPFSIGKPRSLSVMQRNKAPCLSVEPRDDDRAAHAPPHPTKASSQSKETESAKGKMIFLICCNFAKSRRTVVNPGLSPGTLG